MNIELQRLVDEVSRNRGIDELMPLLTQELLDKFDDHDVPEEATDNPLHITALHGHINLTSRVLELKPQLAGKPNSKGQLPLHLAASRGHLQVVKKLVHQASQKSFLHAEGKYGYTPAHIAAINGEKDIVQILVARCKEVLDKTTQRKENLLHLAVRANCSDLVKYCIDEGVNLNEKDVDGNSCLHLACGKRNHQVITCLLEQEGIEVNSKNAKGLTPLDILLVSSWDLRNDVVSLVNILRKAGGEEANEQAAAGNLESRPPRSHRSNGRRSSKSKTEVEKPNDAKTLLLVATLVATMTFSAITNPPGGFIQLPFDKTDATNTAFNSNWMKTDAFPAGRPVLLWQLKAFFLLDSVALFSSIGVILILLCGIPRTTIVMKLLTAALWLAAFYAALAFFSAYIVIYVPGGFVKRLSPQAEPHLSPQPEPHLKREYEGRNRWVEFLLFAWSIVYVLAALWASVRVVLFLLRKGGFIGRKLPNLVANFVPPKNEWFRKTTSIVFIACFLALLGLATWGLWAGFTIQTH